MQNQKKAEKIRFSDFNYNVESEISDYCNRIMNYGRSGMIGKNSIVSCKKHQWACRRFLDDLKKSNKNIKNFPWEFKNENANKYLYWMCLFKHEKGSLAGKQKIPVDYEIFVYGNIYGWVHKETGLRRFRRSFEQLSRKQAKSQDKGIQALYEISQMGEQSAEAYVAATKKDQTRFVWAAADWLYKNSSDGMKNAFVTKFDDRLMQKVILHKASGSFLSRLSKEDKRSGDGPNPQFEVLDEYHLHEDTGYYDLAVSGMKTMPQPLLSIITTAGNNLNNPCYRVEYRYVSDILNPDSPVENDRYFCIVCEYETNNSSETIEVNGVRYEPGQIIDDLKDERLWRKCAPVTWKDSTYIDGVRTDVTESENKPELVRSVKTKTFNIWINETEAGYMNMQLWAACRKKPDIDLSTCPCFPGIDLSEADDLSSITFEFLIGEGVYYILNHSFLPEDAIDEKIKRDKVPYDIWQKAGWMTFTPGPVIDYHVMLQYIKDQIEENGWKKDLCMFDRAKASWLMAEVEKYGFRAVDVPQTFSELSEPIKNLREKVKEKKVLHDGNPVLSWAIGNAVLRIGPSGNFLLDKTKSKNRIDPIVSTITAHSQAMIFKPPKQRRVFIV